MFSRKLVVSLSVLFTVSSTAYPCKRPDFEALIHMNQHELSQDGCVKEHVKLHLKNQPIKVIKIAEKLKRKGLLDGPSLEVEASAFYDLGLYSDALKAHLLSKTTPVQCKTFSPCVWKYWDGDDHWINSFYYQANGDIGKAEEELKAGDLEFFKSCQRDDPRIETANYCSEVRNRLVNSIKSSFSKDSP
ncbi:hypothetical protein QLH52_00695 [Methylomonas sp. OY6]|uniref:Uncharacterized protein n=2 Tax=Methylomonas defluvii TaxID=3045149 RepID=A0ABU4U9D3_9GAMM|nr:hypothetical protein [Methylomonas sp. LW13]MDX8125788.1 hypothetical protein [Methylomonas sp. OY6]